jgi:hypothetical protein
MQNGIFLNPLGSSLAGLFHFGYRPSRYPIKLVLPLSLLSLLAFPYEGEGVKLTDPCLPHSISVT